MLSCKEKVVMLAENYQEFVMLQQSNCHVFSGISHDTTLKNCQSKRSNFLTCSGFTIPAQENCHATSTEKGDN